MRVIHIFLQLALVAAIGRPAFSQPQLTLSHDNLDLVFQRARLENKPVLFMGYAAWCSHCNNMKAHVLTDSAVAAFFNRYFICAGQDMEKEGRPLQRQFNIRTFPTFVVMDTAGRTLYRFSGEYDANAFLEQGRNALNPEKQLPTLRRRFEADVSNGKACLDYIMALRRGGMNTEPAAKKYVAATPADSLLTETSWRILANGINDIGSQEFRFVLAHQKEYEALASPDRVKRKIMAATYETLQQLALAKDSPAYFAKRALVAATGLYSVDSLLFSLDLDLYENTGNWAAYEKTALQLTDKYAVTEFNFLKNIAENFLQHSTDAAALRKAAEWAENSLTQWESYQAALIAAKLYRKINFAAEAKKLAERARAIAVKSNISPAEAEQLLQALR